MKIFTSAQMKKIEENAFKSGISYSDMMENAGKSCARQIEKIADRLDAAPSFSIVCGSGKNGGDGFVIARYLKDYGYNVKVILVNGLPKAQEAAEKYSMLDENDIFDLKNDPSTAFECLITGNYIVDCIFGIGFKGEAEGALAEIIKDINAMRKTVFSIDVPSGLEADSNSLKNIFIKADYTLAVTCRKKVHVMKPSSEYCGTVFTVNIGIPKQCYELEEGFSFFCCDNSFVSSNLPERKYDSNKGDFGHLLCVCGSSFYQGAAVLSCEAAVRCGAGLVTSAFPEKAYPAIASKLTEPLMLPLKSDENGFLSAEAEEAILERMKKASAVLIGCGIGLTENTKKIVYSVIRNAECPVIIDADGLNALSENINILKEAKSQIILTPHPGEMARLTGMSVSDIQKKRDKIALKFALMSKAIVVLKGANTVIASPDGTLCINPTGNPSLSKGGTGDVLAGMISSFVSQGVDALSACVIGCFIHGKCADEIIKKESVLSVTASDIINSISRTLKKTLD